MPIRIAVAMIVAFWAVLFWLTWGTWGSVTIDCFRDPYIAEEINRGKTLYLDLWYPYSPGAPYWNALLFRLFGNHLNVIYWAGSVSALLASLAPSRRAGRSAPMDVLREL